MVRADEATRFSGEEPDAVLGAICRTMAKSLGRRDGSRCWRTAPPM